MERALAFRNLVTSSHRMTDFDYRTQFSFQTLFHFSSYSYCCCPCAFRHELFDYTVGREYVNNKIYEKIEQSIMNGKCPHVTDDADKKWIRETSVTAAHIIVAGNNKCEYIQHHYFYKTGIFKLQLYVVALIKHNVEQACHLYKFCLKTPAPDVGWVLHFKKLTNSSKTVYISSFNAPEAFVHTRDEKILVDLFKQSPRRMISLHYAYDYNKAIEYTIQYNLPNLLKIILTCMYKDHLLPSRLDECILYAIMMEKHEILQQLLEIYGKRSASDDHLTMKRECTLIVRTFKKDCCKNILSKYGIYLEGPLRESRNVVPELTRQVFFELMEMEDFRAHCFSVLQILPVKECHKDRKGRVCPFRKIGPKYYLRRVWCPHPQELREILKLHIHGNCDLESYKEDVRFGLNKDHERFVAGYTGFTQKPRSKHLYKFDGKEHGVYGHDDVDFYLNFDGPFMLEGGFSTNREDLESYLKRDLHSAVHIYLKNYIEENYDRPTALIKQCRKVLRVHFRGKNIHRYLQTITCPQRIKDFILMTDLLKCGNCTSPF